MSASATHPLIPILTGHWLLTHGPLLFPLKEVKWIHTIDVAGLQKQSDDLAKKIRTLNAQIQETNWRVEVEVAD